MEPTILLVNWEKQKQKLKQKFTRLDDIDLLYIDGRKEEMMGRLHIKLGKTREELSKILEEL